MFEYPNRNDVLKRHIEYAENEGKQTPEFENGEYYAINDTQRVLAFSDGIWWKPAKDRLGNYTYYTRLEKQPKVKSVKRAFLVKDRYFEIENL